MHGGKVKVDSEIAVSQRIPCMEKGSKGPWDAKERVNLPATREEWLRFSGWCLDKLDRGAPSNPVGRFGSMFAADAAERGVAARLVATYGEEGPSSRPMKVDRRGSVLCQKGERE